MLKDALFSGAGSADLLLPRRPLSELLAGPGNRHGWARLRLGRRVQRIEPGWRVDGEAFDAVVLACTSVEAARLTADHRAGLVGRRLRRCSSSPSSPSTFSSPAAPLPAPMLALREGPEAPAQFVFDHGQLGGAPGRFAFVVSGAAALGRARRLRRGRAGSGAARI